MTSRLLTNILVENFLNANPHLRNSLLKEAEFIKPLSNEELEGFDIHGDTDEIPGLSSQNQNVDIHKALTPAQLKKVKEPKKGGLVKTLKKLGLAASGVAITIAMLSQAFNHDINSSKNVSLNDNDTEVAIEKVVDVSPESNNKDSLSQQIISEFETSTTFDDELSRDIIKHEGFSSKPYKDVNNVSIGHGTGLYFGTSKKPAIIKKTWRKDLYELYDVPKDLQNKDNKNGISKETAKFIFNKKFSSIKNRLRKLTSHENGNSYIEVFPERIQKAIYDLAYNMGPSFIKKFKQFDINISLAAQAITNNDIDSANTYLKSAANALLYNLVTVKDSKTGKISYKFDPKSKTKYYTDLKKRAEANANAIGSEITEFDIQNSIVSIPDKKYHFENKKYSLKKVFFS